MYKLTYSHNFPYCEKTFKSFDLLADDLSNTFSSQIIDKVAQTLEVGDSYHNEFFEVEHYVGYIYNDMSFTTLWALAQTLAEEVDRDTKVDWFIQNVGVCARMDNGDEIELPWYDMIEKDYSEGRYGNALSSEIDYHTARKIEKTLEEIAPEKGSFVLSFWESDFNIEVEEE